MGYECFEVERDARVATIRLKRPERLNALRRAFDATMKDPEFIAVAKKQHLETIPATGEEMAKVIDNIFNAPKDLQAKTRAALFPQ